MAVRASLLFFCIADLAGVDPMYQYSLAWFVALFLRTVQATPEVLGHIVTCSNSDILTSREGMGWKVQMCKPHNLFSRPLLHCLQYIFAAQSMVPDSCARYSTIWPDTSKCSLNRQETAWIGFSLEDKGLLGRGVGEGRGNAVQPAGVKQPCCSFLLSMHAALNTNQFLSSFHKLSFQDAVAI